MSVRTPFPLNKYAHLEVVDDLYVVDGHEVIAIMANPFPDSDLSNLELDEVEKLFMQGYSIEGYEKYTIGEDNIPVQPYNLSGYPEGSVTRDLYDLLYYKHICIGCVVTNHLNLDSIVEPDYINRLDDLGIEHSYMYGLNKKSTFRTVMVNHAIPLLVITGYKRHELNPWIEVNDRIIISSHQGNLTIVGQLDNEYKLQVITQSNMEKYTAMGLKPPMEQFTKPLIGQII